MENPASVRAKFYNVEKIDDESDEQKQKSQTESDTKVFGNRCLLTIVEPQAIHQSYPGRMHGGVISALLDESIGRAVQFDHPDVWAVTIDLNTKFRKPVPMDETIYIESFITKFGTRAFEGEGRVFTKDGTTLATAFGRYFRVGLEKVFPADAEFGDELFVVEEDLPEYFEIG